MPNWITTRVTAPQHVITAMLNSDGRVDFKTMAPFPGEHDWDGIAMDAETAAKVAANMPLDDHPLIASLEAGSRRDADIRKLSDESFEQYIGMLRNWRKCGFLHSMDFARKTWGTKWNACDQTVDAPAGTASFETAWSCPVPVLQALSKRFPAERIAVVFADEDIGSNCGSFVLLNGEMVEKDIAPSWRDMSDEQQARWRAFAYQVKGWEPEPDEDDEAAAGGARNG